MGRVGLDSLPSAEGETASPIKGPLRMALGSISIREVRPVLRTVRSRKVIPVLMEIRLTGTEGRSVIRSWLVLLALGCSGKQFLFVLVFYKDRIQRLVKKRPSRI